MPIAKPHHAVAFVLCCLAPCLQAADATAPDESTASGSFAGAVSSATPEATAAGVAMLEAGGNAADAAIAIALALGVTEPAGSGIGGQTVMIVKRSGEPAQVIQGTTWSPRTLPPDARPEQLRLGHTAASVPSTPAVLDVAHRRFGSGALAWDQLFEPAIRLARTGFRIGPFRARAFARYQSALAAQPSAARFYLEQDGSAPGDGDRLRQPALARTLQRLARHGADDFYRGAIAAAISADMAANGGWITARDLRDFPEPEVVPALRGSYRGRTVETLPPPFAGWVVLHALAGLEQGDPQPLRAEGTPRDLRLLAALQAAHAARAAMPITDFEDWPAAVRERLESAVKAPPSGQAAAAPGGETTHFSVVDAQGMVVAVTQSIDSYFGAKVAHPELGFLYNNYMQGFQLADPTAPYFLQARSRPLSSMSATILSRGETPELVLGSPGSARIISAVVQVLSHWLDVDSGIEAAVAAYRVHVVPGRGLYYEGPRLDPALLRGMAALGLPMVRPDYGVAVGFLDPYFGGVHALALEAGRWRGAADPRRDGRFASATVTTPPAP